MKIQILVLSFLLACSSISIEAAIADASRLSREKYAYPVETAKSHTGSFDVDTKEAVMGATKFRTAGEALTAGYAIIYKDDAEVLPSDAELQKAAKAIIEAVEIERDHCDAGSATPFVKRLNKGIVEAVRHHKAEEAVTLFIAAWKKKLSAG